jgi:hypothetical protein
MSRPAGVTAGLQDGALLALLEIKAMGIGHYVLWDSRGFDGMLSSRRGGHQHLIGIGCREVLAKAE